MEYNGIKQTIITDTKNYPEWEISESIFRYDPREVLAKFYMLNWACFKLTNQLESPRFLFDVLFDCLRIVAPEINKRCYDIANDEERIVLPFSRGGLVRSISSFVNESSKQPKPKEYVAFKTRQFETDVFMYIQQQQSVLHAQEVTLMKSAKTPIEGLAAGSILGHHYNANIDEPFYLAFGKKLIDGLTELMSNNSVDHSVLETYLLNHTSCANITELLNHFFRYTIDSRKWKNPFSKTSIESGLKMGLTIQEIIERAKTTRKVRGSGLLQSMAIMDAGPIPGTDDRGQVITDYPSLLKYLSIGFIDHFYWTTLNPNGVSVKAFGKYKGLRFEEFINECLKPLRDKKPHRDRKCFIGTELMIKGKGKTEYADFTIHERNRCIIGQVKQIGWTDKQEYAENFSDLIKDTEKDPFIKSVGLLQLIESIKSIHTLFDKKELRLPAKRLKVYPVLVLLQEWLDCPFLKCYIQDQWEKLLTDLELPMINGNQIQIMKLTIISGGDFYVHHAGMTFKSAFKPGKSVIGNPSPILANRPMELHEFQTDLMNRYADVLR